ncbi:MAG: PTS sugar transporter subunit IIA [Gammaproteobacteria bacterium]|nr:PTS sugar transporter subunit IIA [Gammaproteobacteria bacterium]
MIFVNPELVDHNQTEIIRFLCSKLESFGFVDTEYTDEVLSREVIHPTGLPTMPYASAVPHANPTGVKKTGIALAILEKPVSFFAMDNPKRALDVNLIFLMAFLNGDQVKLLSWVSNILCNQDNVKKITEANSPRQAYEIIEPFFITNNPNRGENDTNR